MSLLESAVDLAVAASTAGAALLVEVVKQLYFVIVFISSYAVAAAVWPFGVLFFVLSPVIYTVAYALAPLYYIAALLPKLEVQFMPHDPRMHSLTIN